MNISINSPQPHNVSLRQDFGDSPVGRLGNGTVQKTSAQVARTGGANTPGTAAQIRELGSRFLNAATPHGVRAESKALAGLKATSAQVGDLLGALSKSSGHSVDGLTAKKLIDTLGQTAAPLTSRGVGLDQVFGQRVSVHVQNMSTAQLVALRDGVKLAQTSALAHSAGPQLSVVKNAVDRELTQRLLDTATQKMAPILAKLVAELPREAANAGSVAFAFHELDGAAFTVLTGHGESQSADNAENLANLKLALIKQTLSAAIDEGSMSLPHMGAILGHLPSQVLRNLDMKNALIGSEVPFAMERLVSGAIGLRAERTETAFMQAADSLLARTLTPADDGSGIRHNPQGFAQDIIAAAQNLTQLRVHGDINHLHFPEAVGDKSAELLAHLERLCTPANLQVDELSHSQLKNLSQALGSLGVERGSAHLAAELTRRKDEASTSFNTALLATCTAAQSKDPHTLLQSLKTFADASSGAVQTLQRLGAPIDGADKVMEFRANQSMVALKELGADALMSTLAALNTPEMKSLQASLGEMGQALLEMGDDNGRALYNAQLDLRGMTQFVREVLVQAHGLSLPAMPDNTNYQWADLSPAGQGAMAAVMGVEMGSHGAPIVKSGVAGADFQAAFQANLKTMSDRPSEEQLALATLPDGSPTGVTNALWLDLARANYSIAGPDGTPQPILNKSEVNAATPTEKMAAVAQLRTLVQGNDALLLKLAQFANQNTLSGFMGGMIEDNPLRLPDGSSGQPVSPRTGTTSYTLSSDGAGGVLMNIQYSVRNVQSLMRMDGTQIPLDPTKSQFDLRVQVRIDADLAVSTTVPVRFSQNLQLDSLPSAGDIARMKPAEIVRLRNDISALEKELGSQLNNAKKRGDVGEQIAIKDQQAIYADRLQACSEAVVTAVQHLDAQTFLNTLGRDVSFIMSMPANSPVRVALREHLQSEFALENLQFLETVAGGEHRNLAGARQIYQQRVSATAPDQINVSGQTRTDLGQALERPDAVNNTAGQFDTLFNDAFSTIANAVSNDNVPRLIAKLNKMNPSGVA